MSDVLMNSVKMLISSVAYFLIVFGLGYLFAPKIIDEINNMVNKVLLQTDNVVTNHRAVTGMIFIVVAFILLILVNLK